MFLVTSLSRLHLFLDEPNRSSDSLALSKQIYSQRIGNFYPSDPKSDSLEVGNVKDFKVHVFKSSSELLEKLHEKWSKVGKKPYPAMYSSIYGGIILDPALMVIPIDDHRIADENRTRLLVLLILKLDASDYQSLKIFWVITWTEDGAESRAYVPSVWTSLELLGRGWGQ